MAIIFTDGFENGDFSAWTSSYAGPSCIVEVQSANPHSGIYNAHSLTGGAGNTGAVFSKTITAMPIAHARIFVKFNQLNIASGQIITILSLSGASGYNATVYVYNDGASFRWILQTNEGGVYQPSGAGQSRVITGVWYCVELMRDVTNGVLTLWIDDVQEHAINRTISSNTVQVSAGLVFVNPGVHELFVDDVVIADAYIGTGEPPPVNFTLTYQSNPIVIPCTVNGQILNPGGSIQVPSGTSVTISVPSEVTV